MQSLWNDSYKLSTTVGVYLVARCVKMDAMSRVQILVVFISHIANTLSNGMHSTILSTAMGKELRILVSLNSVWKQV